MTDEVEGPYTEVTYVLYVKAKVEATIEATHRVTARQIAAYYEVEESEVTEEMVIEFAENADSDVDGQWDEDAFDLIDIDDWTRVDADVLATHRVRITPPGWVPLWDDEHEHTDRGNRDMCQAGRCYLDTIVPRSEPVST